MKGKIEEIYPNIFLTNNSLKDVVESLCLDTGKRIVVVTNQEPWETNASFGISNGTAPDILVWNKDIEEIMFCMIEPKGVKCYIVRDN